MYMCTEFVIQVPKQKNARVPFPVGMVNGKCSCDPVSQRDGESDSEKPEARVVAG